MSKEIEEQPAALRYASKELGRQLEGFEFGSIPELIVIAARGSSDHAALYAKYLFEVQCGIPTLLAAPSVITQFHAKVHYPSSLAIGISQSGAAPDVTEVIAEFRSQGHQTLAITNTKDSLLSHASQTTMFLSVGEEHAVAATKTYTSTLLALYRIAQKLGAKLPDPGLELPTDSWIKICQETVGPIADLVVTAHPLFILGRGYDFATAHETALKLIECALVLCKAYSLADFEHGPRALLDQHSLCIVYGGGDLGTTQVIRPPNTAVEPVLRPVWDAIYGQILALACARRKGIDPDRPRGLAKISRTY